MFDFCKVFFYKIINLNLWCSYSNQNYFFNWFGDWVNNPESSSKVVDKNGEPLIVYHYTNETFDTFDINYFGQTDLGDHGRGFYLTPMSPE